LKFISANAKLDYEVIVIINNYYSNRYYKKSIVVIKLAKKYYFSNKIIDRCFSLKDNWRYHQ